MGVVLSSVMDTYCLTERKISGEIKKMEQCLRGRVEKALDGERKGGVRWSDNFIMGTEPKNNYF